MKGSEWYLESHREQDGDERGGSRFGMRVDLCMEQWRAVWRLTEELLERYIQKVSCAFQVILTSGRRAGLARIVQGVRTALSGAR